LVACLCMKTESLLMPHEHFDLMELSHSRSWAGSGCSCLKILAALLDG
jgi:hypothetical protein